MKPPNLLKSFICCLVISLASCKQEGGRRFQLDTALGKSYHFLVTIEEWQGINSDTPSPTRLTYAFTLKVREHADSMQAFDFVIDGIVDARPATRLIKEENGSVTVVLSGKNELVNDSNANMTQFVKDTLQLNMNHSGEVRLVEGYEAIRNKIVKLTGSDPRTVGSVIRKYVGVEAVTDLVNQLFFYLPAKEIKLGDQWVRNVTLIEKAPVKYSHLIKVKDITGDSVHLSVQTVVSSRLGGDGKLIVEGELSGEVMASYSTGVVYTLYLQENSVIHTDTYDVKKKRTISVIVTQSPAAM